MNKRFFLLVAIFFAILVFAGFVNAANLGGPATTPVQSVASTTSGAINLPGNVSISCNSKVEHCKMQKKGYVATIAGGNDTYCTRVKFSYVTPDDGKKPITLFLDEKPNRLVTAIKVEISRDCTTTVGKVNDWVSAPKNSRPTKLSLTINKGRGFLNLSQSVSLEDSPGDPLTLYTYAGEKYNLVLDKFLIGNFLTHIRGEGFDISYNLYFTDAKGNRVSSFSNVENQPSGVATSFDDSGYIDVTLGPGVKKATYSDGQTEKPFDVGVHTPSGKKPFARLDTSASVKLKSTVEYTAKVSYKNGEIWTFKFKLVKNSAGKAVLQIRELKRL